MGNNTDMEGCKTHSTVIICLVTVVINKAQKSGGRMILCQDCSKSLGHLWNPVILTL